MTRQLPWLLTAHLFLAARLACAQPGNVEHSVIFSDPQLFAGWPANEGMWQWGNEILVGFNVTKYQETVDGHNVDPNAYQWVNFARSLDGGETWTTEVHPEISIPGQFNMLDQYVQATGYPAIPAPVPSPGGFDFTSPGFALKARKDSFWVTEDRGHNWSGPYALSHFDQDYLMARTNYVALDSQSILLFYEGTDIHPSVGDHGRTMVVETTDGGQSFQQIAWLTPDPLEGHDVSSLPAYSIMPGVAKLDDGTILAAVRSRRENQLWTDVVASTDSGHTWETISTPVTNNNNPASLVPLGGDRVALVYGYRNEPAGIYAKISEDGGVTWPREYTLRNDGREWDVGYVRAALRNDGRLAATYYYTTDDLPANFIGSTVWDVPEHLPASQALVAHYTFNHSTGPTLKDTAGVPAADGAVTNVSFVTSGAGAPHAVFGNSGSFNGATSHVSFGDGGHPESFDLGTGDFTISGWLKAPNNAATGSTGNRAVFQNIDYMDGGWAFEIGRADRTYAGEIFFTVGGGGSSVFSLTQTFSDARVDNNQWHWVAIVHSNGAIRMFVDGILQDDTGQMQPASTATAPSEVEAQFGMRGASQAPFVGQLDDWRIYRAALGQLFDDTGNVLAGGELFDVWQAGIDAIIPGDYLPDGYVDQADYDTWRVAYGSSTSAADGNRDGIVDAADYTLWRDNFGRSAFDGFASSAGAPIPEFESALIAVISAAFFGCFAPGLRRGRPVRTKVKPFHVTHDRILNR